MMVHKVKYTRKILGSLLLSARDGYLVSDAISGEEALSSLPFQSPREDQALVQKGLHLEQSTCEEPLGGSIAKNIFSHHSTAEEDIPITDSDTILVDYDDAQSEDTDKHARDDPSSVDNIYCFEEGHTEVKIDNPNVVKNFLDDDDGNFFSFTPLKLESRSLRHLESRTKEAFEGSFSVGSTSRSSSGPRTSSRHRDSVSEDPFLSSSRSCPTWESITAFQKYDKEMVFCDQISPQKLNETKLHKSVDVLPRSLSQKIVQKLTKRNRANRFPKKPIS